MQIFRVSCKEDILRDCLKEIELEKVFKESRGNVRNILSELRDKEFSRPKSWLEGKWKHNNIKYIF